jgi:hypothetical protein
MIGEFEVDLTSIGALVPELGADARTAGARVNVLIRQ